MKNLVNIALAALLISGMTFSCKKKDSKPEEETTTTTTTTGGTPSGAVGSFQWQENGGAVITADSAFWTTWSSGTGVRAMKGGYQNYFEVNWNGPNMNAVGSYSLSSGSFTFLKGSATYTNSSTQNINVTANSGTGPNISGNFNVAVSGGTISTITGTFTSIKKK